MKLRITLEGRAYVVEVEILPEQPIPSNGFHMPDGFIPADPMLEFTAEDRICRSPIAGVIVSLAASLAQRVKKDDPLLTIEAMKMQSVIGAPVDGTVEAIEVRPGDAVRPGQVLVRLE